MSPSIPRQSMNPSTSRTAKTFSTNWVLLTAWQSLPISFDCSAATSRTFRSRCARWVGPLATHFPFSAPNTTNSARSKPATAMVMVAQFPCLKLLSMVDAGKCSLKEVVAHLTAAVRMVAPFCDRVSGVFGAGAHACAWRSNVTVFEFVRFENGEGSATLVFGGLAIK